MKRLKDNIHEIYQFAINPERVFNLTCNRSRLFCRQNGINDETMMIRDQDKDTFNHLMDTAMAQLFENLAAHQRVREAQDEDGKIYDIDNNEVTFLPYEKEYSTSEDKKTATGKILINLIVTTAYDDTVLSSLQTKCEEYLSREVMENYYGKPYDAEASLMKVVSALNYRKEPVKFNLSIF